MIFKLNEEQLANQEKYRAFAEAKVRPLAEEMDENGPAVLRRLALAADPDVRFQ